MPLAGLKEVLSQARRRGYGVPSLLAGNLEMVIGQVMAAEEKASPLILAYNRGVTPKVPMELGIPLIVNAATRAGVPVATILDHGQNLEEVVRAIHLGTSSVMFDGSNLSFEENVRQTKEIVRVAHSVGVSVEAELGSMGGSEAASEEGNSERAFTDPDAAAEFVERTGVDALAISFGNVHGLYKGEPCLDLERVRRIYALVEVPLVMHGASGLDESAYAGIIESGISKVCYYTAMGMGACRDLRDLMADGHQNVTVYHHIISWAVDYFHAETKRLLDLLGCSGMAR
ncbi:MAG: class II fructose-bisphosphate aldolase [Chloroflexi bacterium]|nr:class II fructose-bisphosphate aldolase [Chloroflexota bacterium]